MIGRDKSRTYWKVLKIDRQDPSELNIREDSTTYTESECSDLLKRIHEGNKSTGGLKFVTTCYGIVGMWGFFFSFFFCFDICQSLGALEKLTHCILCCCFRVYQIFGAILHAAYYEKTTDWCNLWAHSICHLQE